MWGAIRSDLLEFVNTVKADASKSIETVIGVASTEPTEEDEMLQLTKDLTRNFNTYKEPVPEANKREYDRFRRDFSLASRAVDIGRVLDEEPDAARFYAELVPVAVSAEEFWGRYFFKLSLLSRGALDALGLDDEEEEEVGWESNEESAAAEQAEGSKGSHRVSTPNGESQEIALGGPAYAAAVEVEERDRMRSQIRALAMRVTELEKLLAERNAEIKELKSRVSVHDGSDLAPSSSGSAPSMMGAAASLSPTVAVDNDDATPRAEDAFLPNSLHIKVKLSDAELSLGDHGHGQLSEPVTPFDDAEESLDEPSMLEDTEDRIPAVTSATGLANLEDDDWENSWS